MKKKATSGYLCLSEGDEQKLITRLPSTSTVSCMSTREVQLRPDRDHIQSLRSLAKLRCLVHGDLVMVQRRDGRIVFWCGCERPGESFKKPERILKQKVLQVKR